MIILIEQWRSIEEYENLYQISNYGNVKNHKNQLLKPMNDGNYLNVDLYKNEKKKRYKIHRLVAKAFIPNPEDKKEVNHIDGNKLNNKYSNLEWVTPSENMIHAFKKGLAKVNKNMQGKFGEINPNSIIRLQYDINGNFIKKWSCAKEIERQLGIHHSHISKCCKGKLKTAGGYIWRYEESGVC